MEAELAFFVPLSGRSIHQVSVDVKANASCSDALESLLQWLEVPEREKGAWYLVECWRNCERVIGSEELIVPLYQSWGGEEESMGRFCLRPSPQSTKRRLRKPIPSPSLPIIGKLSYKKLLLIHCGLRRATLHRRRQYRSILLTRLAHQQPLWGPQEPTLAEVLNHQLTLAQEQNLALTTEIADLNISSTRLAGQIPSLQDHGRELTKKLAALQVEVAERRKAKERELTRGSADAKTELLKLKRELDLRNRLNTVQNTKVQSQKEALAKKRQVLTDKREELKALTRGLEEGRDAVASHKRYKVADTTPCIDEKLEPQGIVERGDVVKPPTPSDWWEVDSLASDKPTQQPLTRDRLESQSMLQTQDSSLCPQDTSSSPSTPVHQRDTPRKIPSTSKKRHASMLEAKTRQLLEEESSVFRESHHTPSPSHDSTRQKRGQPEAVKKLDFSPSAGQPQSESEPDYLGVSPLYGPPTIPAEFADPDPVSMLLAAPEPNSQWYKSQDSPTLSYRQKIEQAFEGTGELSMTTQYPEAKGNPNRKPTATENLLEEVMSSLEKIHEETKSREKRKREVRKVHFCPGDVILNAAMEGDLDLLKHCVRELGSCAQTSDKGATCLHNGVCSGSIETVQYVVEMGCNINAQDVDGWTPLHLAVAYSNPAMLHYLINNGASLFLLTREGEAPLKIGLEEYNYQQNIDNAANSALKECIEHLMDVHSSLGRANGGKIFALFSRRTTDPDELSFHEGEQLIVTRHGDDASSGDWWWAKNSKGRMGYVPSNLFGVSRRYSVIL